MSRFSKRFSEVTRKPAGPEPRLWDRSWRRIVGQEPWPYLGDGYIYIYIIYIYIYYIYIYIIYIYYIYIYIIYIILYIWRFPTMEVPHNRWFINHLFHLQMNGWLVVQCAHLKKYERVRQWVSDDMPYMKWKIKHV